MDTVTSLAISQNHLISGSKDKNLRLWALDHSIYNLKSTVHASNDYINTVESIKFVIKRIYIIQYFTLEIEQGK
jgi:WD40 repeat protein